jgi:hypothetical protein
MPSGSSKRERAESVQLSVTLDCDGINGYRDRSGEDELPERGIAIFEMLHLVSRHKT